MPPALTDATPFHTEAMINEVLKLTRDKDAGIREQSAWWLAWLPPEALKGSVQSNVAANLRQVLADKNPVVALAGVRVLVDSEPDSKAVAETISRIVSQKQDELVVWEYEYSRYIAVKHAAIMGPRAAPAAAAIAQILREPETNVGSGTLRRGGGGRGGGGGFFSVMQGAAQRQDLTFHEMAAFALARIGKPAEVTLPIINEVLKNETLKSADNDPEGWTFNRNGLWDGHFNEPIRLNELLLAARLRIQEKPVPDPQQILNEIRLSRGNVEMRLPLEPEQHERFLLALAHFKLLREERDLLQAHFGPGAETDTFRELNVQVEAARQQFQRKPKPDEVPNKPE